MKKSLIILISLSLINFNLFCANASAISTHEIIGVPKQLDQRNFIERTINKISGDRFFKSQGEIQTKEHKQGAELINIINDKGAKAIYKNNNEQYYAKMTASQESIAKRLTENKKWHNGEKMTKLKRLFFTAKTFEGLNEAGTNHVATENKINIDTKVDSTYGGQEFRLKRFFKELGKPKDTKWISADLKKIEEPVVVEPVVAKPVVAEPVAVEPVVAKPVAVEPDVDYDAVKTRNPGFLVDDILPLFDPTYSVIRHSKQTNLEKRFEIKVGKKTYQINAEDLSISELSTKSTEKFYKKIGTLQTDKFNRLIFPLKIITETSSRKIINCPGAKKKLTNAPSRWKVAPVKNATPT